jgi:hypothetical protein
VHAEGVSAGDSILGDGRHGSATSAFFITNSRGQIKTRVLANWNDTAIRVDNSQFRAIFALFSFADAALWRHFERTPFLVNLLIPAPA